MLKLENKRIIEELGVEMAIQPSFIEKDFYVVELLSVLSTFQFENAKLIFSGGTCLSKAHKLIQRFSEDIDFKIQTATSYTRGQRRQYRDALINEIKKIKELKFIEESFFKRNESRFFSFL